MPEGVDNRQVIKAGITGRAETGAGTSHLINQMEKDFHHLAVPWRQYKALVFDATRWTQKEKRG